MFPNSSPFSSDGMPIGVGPDGMAAPPLPPGIAAPAPEAPPTPPASECNDLDFTLENVDKVGGRTSGEAFFFRPVGKKKRDCYRSSKLRIILPPPRMLLSHLCMRR